MEDKIAIIHTYLIDKESQKDTARKHFVKPALVQALVTKAKKNKGFLDELRAKRLEMEMKINRVQEVAA